MARIILVVLAFAVAACGGSDTASEPAKTVDAAPAAEANTTPAVSAPAPPAAETPAAPADTPAATADEPKSQECLDLVAQGNFADATQVCMAALAIDPNDTAVQQALATAKSQSASAMPDAATGAAKGAAESQLDDLTGGALGDATN